MKTFRSGTETSIFIPSVVCRKMNIGIGDELEWYIDENNRLVISKSERKHEKNWTLF